MLLSVAQQKSLSNSFEFHNWTGYPNQTGEQGSYGASVETAIMARQAADDFKAIPRQVLSPAQLAKWKAMMGIPLPESIHFRLRKIRALD